MSRQPPSRFPLIVPDQHLLSPRRIARAIHLWLWLIVVPDEPAYVPLRRMLRFNGRRYAEYCHDTRHKQGA